jgi:peptide/nickel transport system permease protein
MELRGRSETGLSRLHARTITWSLGFLCILVLLGAALALPFQDAYISKLSDRLISASAIHPLGTDELGRDLFSRFIVGTQYTVLAALLTTLLAGMSGWLVALAIRPAPVWCSRLISILARACFIFPSFLLAPSWPNRLLMTVFCLFPILPLCIITLLLIVAGNLTGLTTSFVLGPLFGVGIAYVISLTNRPNTPVSRANAGHSFRQLIALTAPVFAWSAYFQTMLDILGLGVQPPRPSWGSVLSAQSISLWPQAAAGLGFLVIGMTAFAFSDALARGRTRRY